jgi:hypothetical protein
MGDIECGKNGCFSKIKSSIIFKPIINEGVKNLVNSIEFFLKLKLSCNYQIHVHQFGGQVTNGSGCFAFKHATSVISYFTEWNSTNLSSIIQKYMNQ